jgi:hypothetical protein
VRNSKSNLKDQLVNISSYTFEKWEDLNDRGLYILIELETISNPSNFSTNRSLYLEALSKVGLL